MAVGLDEILGNLDSSQRFFRAHLNEMQEEQWDWKPYPACRSIREILLHWAEIFAAGDAELESGLKVTVPDVRRVQQLMKKAGSRFADEFRTQFADSSIDAVLPNGTAVGTALASLANEDNYHAGQISFIRLATAPEWDWVRAIHQTPSE